MLINKKKRTCHLLDFAVTAEDWMKRKENDKLDKYLDFTRELKNC